MFIYKLINTVNGKSYIGQAVDLEKRIKEHSHGHGNMAIARAIRKYGWNTFRIEVLEENAAASELDELEIKHIREHRTFEEGYNSTLGGGGRRGFVVSQATKDKIALKLTGNRNFEGHTFTLETKKVLSDKKAKTWKVKCPQGIEKVITNLRAFCIQHGLTTSAMSLVANGKRTHHKGYHVCHVS